MNYFNESFNQETEMKKSYDKTSIGSADMGSTAPMMDKPCQGVFTNSGCMQAPIYECPQERVCHRYICHEVPHIMPCNTRVINHHVYRHTYTPQYTCCEENVCENVFGPRCC